MRKPIGIPGKPCIYKEFRGLYILLFTKKWSVMSTRDSLIICDNLLSIVVEMEFIHLTVENNFFYNSTNGISLGDVVYIRIH